MKHTLKQRMNIVDAFRVARARIHAGHDRYICHALWPPMPGTAAALRIVQTRMGASRDGVVARGQLLSIRARDYGLEEWLMDHSVVKRWPSQRDMREYRLRWLDALIKEFSE